MATPDISPQQFFRKASSFVSQARGTFTIINNFSFVETINRSTGYTPKIQESIKNGFKLLNEGILAKSVNIPGQQFARFSSTLLAGPERQMPHQIMMNDLDIEFYLVGETSRNAADLYTALRAWQKYIVGPQITPTNSNPVIMSDSTIFAVNYYDEFVQDAQVKLYGPDNQQNLDMTFYEVYPLTIGGIQTAWDGQDAPATLSATFSYFYNDVTEF